MVVELNSFICPNDIGNKAKSLVDLNRYGYKTPKVVVINTKEYDKVIKDIKSKIELLINKLQYSNIEFISKQIKSLFDNISISEKVLIDLERFINKNSEYILRISLDGIDDEKSFSGICPTRKDININNIEENIIECYKSLFSYNSLYYILKNNINYKDIKIAIIIQEYIKEECIGYAKGINPVTLNTKEISLFLSSKDTTEHYIYDITKKDLIIADEYKLINKKRLFKVFNLLVDVQLNFGYPIEIEIALTKSDIYVIQVRKMSSILYDNSDIIYENYEVSSKKLLFDLYASSYNDIINKYSSEYSNKDGIKLEENAIILFNKCYYNVLNKYDIINSFVKIDQDFFKENYKLKNILKSKEYIFNNLKRYKNNKKHIMNLNNINNIFEDINKTYNKLYNSYCKKMSKLTSNNVEKDWVELVTKDYKKLNDLYFEYNIICEIEKNKLYNKLKKYISNSQFNELIYKKEELSEIKIDKELNKVVYKINADEKSYRYWFSTSTLKILKNYELEESEYFHPEFRKFIDSYGYLSYFKMDISENFYVEDVEEVIRDIKKRLAHPTKPVNYKLKRENILDKIKEQLIDKKYDELINLITNVQDLIIKEDTIHNLVLKFNFIIKRYTKMLSKVYLTKKIIEEENDIWHIDLLKILDFTEGEISIDDLKNSVSTNKTYFNFFRNFDSENIIGSQKERLRKANYQGKGMSCNIVTGKVRMIKNISELETLTSEDILVTKNINNNLLFQLPNISGIIVSYENIDSCCQNIIREMKLPCIYLDNSSKKLKNNSIIRIDGYTGDIKIIKK